MKEKHYVGGSGRNFQDSQWWVELRTCNRKASLSHCITSAAPRNVLLDSFKFITLDRKSNGGVRKQRPPGTCTTSFRFNTAICFRVPRNGNISAEDAAFTEMTDVLVGQSLFLALESEGWWKRHVYLIGAVASQAAGRMIFLGLRSSESHNAVDAFHWWMSNQKLTYLESQSTFTPVTGLYLKGGAEHVMLVFMQPVVQRTIKAKLWFGLDNDECDDEEPENVKAENVNEMWCFIRRCQVWQINVIVITTT